MATSAKGGADERAPLRARVGNVRHRKDAVEFTVVLRNESDRTLHYIGDVRAIDFEPTTGHLRLRLTDRGREVVPGGMYVMPTFRAIEPRSEAAVTLKLPRTIVRLAPTATPTSQPTFEEHTIADAAVVELEIGWSRTPYYADVRESPQPLEAWEDGLVRAQSSMRDQRRG